MERTGDPTHGSPVTPGARIPCLDVLRGFALLGILVVNIQSFSMIGAAYSNPTAYGELTGTNLMVWIISHLLVDRKLMAIFSMLFGAGIVMMAERIEASGGLPSLIHIRRMGWLIAFGVLHAYLFWYGDILFFYGACGLLVFPLRRLSPRALIVTGLLVVGVASWFSVASGVATELGWGPDPAQTASRWAPDAEAIRLEVEAYRGGWLEQMRERAPTALAFETGVFLFWGLWRAGGLMLIGMALFKLGVFGGARSTRFYVVGLFAGLGVGLPVVAWGVARNFAANWSPEYSQYFGNQFNYWASLPVSFGYVCLVVLLCRAPWSSGPRTAAAAVGRTALSNYLLQSILCTTLFYGHGLGWFGSVERGGQLLVVLAVWVLQVVLSLAWLHRFQFGPAEWLWRSLTYLRFQPMRRGPAPLAARGPRST